MNLSQQLLRNVRFLLVLTILTSCTLKKNLVKTISIDVANQKITYKRADNTLINPDDANIHEGSSVDLEVGNYNPLAQTVTVNPIQAVVNYQTPSPLITGFFPVTNSTPGTPSVQADKVVVGEIPFVSDKNKNPISNPPCASDPVYQAVKSYMDLHIQMATNMKGFKNFYNTLSFLNNQYNSFKLYKSLPLDCICPYIKSFNTSVNEYLNVVGTINNNQTSPIAVNCPPAGNGCDAISIFNQLQNADILYKQYFADAVTKLGTIQSSITKSLGGASLADYSKKNFANCSNDPVVIESTTINADIEKETSDITAFNSLYSSQYDKDITSDITEYNMLFLLQYTFVQANNKVDGVDEFKTSIAVTSIATPASSYSFNIDVPVTRFVKIDFSAGAFFSTLTNENAQLKQKSATNDSVTVVPYKTNNYTVGPMGFINFHSQVPGSLQWGLYLGTGLAFNQPTQVVLSGGGELLLGRSQRIILHVGAALSQVTRVNSPYPDGSYFLNSGYVPSTISKWDSKFMFGLSWNLTKSQ
jgi:hypothetical protein